MPDSALMKNKLGLNALWFLWYRTPCTLHRTGHINEEYPNSLVNHCPLYCLLDIYLIKIFVPTSANKMVIPQDSIPLSKSPEQQFLIFFYSWHTDFYGLCLLWFYVLLLGDFSVFCGSVSRLDLCSNKLSMSLEVPRNSLILTSAGVYNRGRVWVVQKLGSEPNSQQRRLDLHHQFQWRRSK